MRWTQRGETPVFTGYDMTAVLAMANAIGLSAALVADLFPIIEQAAVAASNQQSAGGDLD